MSKATCIYECFYQGKQATITASTLWEATQRAREKFKVPKSKQGLLSVVLVEVDGKTVTHDGSEF